MRTLIAVTATGPTLQCADQARHLLETAGIEVRVFDADGAGGRAMETLVLEGHAAGVLDITTTELAAELVGGIHGAGNNRLTGAAIRKIPQVISVGSLDIVNFGPRNTIPRKFENRRFYPHDESTTFMRTTPEENDRLGKEIAEKASAAGGPTAILLPLKGISVIDCEDGPFWWPEADQALFQSIHNWIGPWVKVIELDMHINDPLFAEQAVQTLLNMLPRTV